MGRKLFYCSHNTVLATALRLGYRTRIASLIMQTPQRRKNEHKCASSDSLRDYVPDTGSTISEMHA